MYAVFQSNQWRNNLSNSIKARLTKLEKVNQAEETIYKITHSVDTIVKYSKRLDSGIHAKQPSKSKIKQSKSY